MNRFDRLSLLVVSIMGLLIIIFSMELYEYHRTTIYRREYSEIQQENILQDKEYLLEFRQHIIDLELDESYEILDELRKKQPPEYTPIRCLADNIYYEAGFEPYEGQLAVAQVTINRAKEKPNNICSIVYFKKINPRTGKKEAAFSWTLGKKWKPRGVNSSRYRECQLLARAVLTKKVRSGIIDSSVKYYHAVYVTPSWINEHEEVVTIGNHIFYR